MSVHILFLTDNFFPEVNAPASRTHDHAKQWVKAGHRVTIITCVPNFPIGKVFDGYKNKLWQTEMVDDIRVIRVWSYIAANEGFAKRLFDYLSFMITSFLASFLIRRIDVVVGTSPQFFTAVSAWLIAEFKRKPFVFELRDLWPDSIRAVGAMQESKVLDLIEKLELFLYRRADRIISVTHSFKANLENRGIDGNKIDVVTNGVDTTKFKFKKKNHKLKEQLGLTGKFIAGYIGTHGLAHGLETILSAAKITSENIHGTNIHYLFLGDGAEKNKLLQFKSDLRLNNVTFLDTVPKSEVVEYWSILDVSIINLINKDLFKAVIPSKIFESMSMGVPVLHTIHGESAEIVKQMGIGVVIEPESPTEMAGELINLYLDPLALTSFSRNGQRAAAGFDRKNLAHDMLSVLERVTKK